MSSLCLLYLFLPQLDLNNLARVLSSVCSIAFCKQASISNLLQKFCFLHHARFLKDENEEPKNLHYVMFITPCSLRCAISHGAVFSSFIKTFLAYPNLLLFQEGNFHKRLGNWLVKMTLRSFVNERIIALLFRSPTRKQCCRVLLTEVPWDFDVSLQAKNMPNNTVTWQSSISLLVLVVDDNNNTDFWQHLAFILLRNRQTQKYRALGSVVIVNC